MANFRPLLNSVGSACLMTNKKQFFLKQKSTVTTTPNKFWNRSILILVSKISSQRFVRSFAFVHYRTTRKAFHLHFYNNIAFYIVCAPVPTAHCCLSFIFFYCLRACFCVRRKTQRWDGGGVGSLGSREFSFFSCNYYNMRTCAHLIEGIDVKR